MESAYDDSDAMRKAVTRETGHRLVVGGMWEEMGELQLGFMKRRGMLPHHRLLDIGCGSLRGGVRFVEYLEAGNYYGFDINAPILDAGYEREILTRPDLAAKLPRENLAVIDDFDASGFGQAFDFAIAQSVFSHFTMNTIRICMERLHTAMAEGGVLCATYFRMPDGQPSGEPVRHTPGGVTSYGNRDPYHYRPDDMRFLIAGLPWELVDEMAWDHPRDQRMLIFRKT